MPRSFNQKLKILYIMKIFWERTDRDHGISVREIVSILCSWGIKAERKTVYDDIEALRYFGLKIGTEGSTEQAIIWKTVLLNYRN